jgi:hypothetical protein
MEPNNIENQFREKINSREIKPSAKAWDRLDAMLTVAEKPRRNYRWMYFAASFLGFMLIATVFLSQTEEAIDAEHQKVVFEQNKIEKTDEILEIPSENNAADVVSNTQKTIIPQKSKAILKAKLTYIEERSAVTQVAVIVHNQDSSAFINQKTGVKVNVNSLLAAVDAGKSTPSIAKNTIAVSVKASELLSQVDDELDRSFRERVIQNVNKKYKEVKDAVANRNLK